ncbi:MAG: V-type ATP synthase subunit E [Ignavibacteriales bacterium]
MGLDKILEKVDSDARAEAARIEAQAKEQAQAMLRTAEEKGKALAAEIAEKARIQAEEQAKRITTLAGLDARRQGLDAKQRLVEQAFHEAESRLAGIPDAEYCDLIRKMLLDAVKTGDEEIILSKKDLSRITPSFIAEVNRQLAASGRNGALKISGSTREMLGGFVLVDGKVESNNTFDVALRLKRDDLEPEVAGVLFGEAGGSQG